MISNMTLLTNVIAHAITAVPQMCACDICWANQASFCVNIVS